MGTNLIHWPHRTCIFPTASSRPGLPISRRQLCPDKSADQKKFPHQDPLRSMICTHATPPIAIRIQVRKPVFLRRPVMGGWCKWAWGGSHGYTIISGNPVCTGWRGLRFDTTRFCPSPLSHRPLPAFPAEVPSWQKTKVDVFVSLLRIDTIPAIFITRRKLLHTHRMQDKCGRWQRCHLKNTGPDEDTSACAGHDDPRSRGDGLRTRPWITPPARTVIPGLRMACPDPGQKGNARVPIPKIQKIIRELYRSDT
jgi:hypothetical protein